MSRGGTPTIDSPRVRMQGVAPNPQCNLDWRLCDAAEGRKRKLNRFPRFFNAAPTNRNVPSRPDMNHYGERWSAAC